MVNLADLPNASALSGTETLPMQQGSGAVKVTANRLLSRAAGGYLPFEIGGQRVVTVTNVGMGVGSPPTDSPLLVAGGQDLHVRVGGFTPGVAATLRVQSRNSADTSSYYGDIKVDADRGALVLCSPGTAGPYITDTLFLVGGNALVGKAVANTSVPGVVVNRAGQLRLSVAGAGADTTVGFYRDGTTTAVGSITTTGAATAYNTSSDYRLPWKAGHVPLSGSGDFIDALNPRFFPVVGHAGFIAHEFAVASPSSVTGEKDAVDEDGNPVYQQMDASSPDVMANIIAELQSLRRRVAALEAAA